MKEVLASIGSGFAISVILVTIFSSIPVPLASQGESNQGSSGLPPGDPRLLETANVSDAAENLTATEPGDPRLLETANVSDAAENLTATEPGDPRLLETP